MFAEADAFASGARRSKRMHVRFDRVARQRWKVVLPRSELRRPIQLRIHAAERAEDRLAKRERQGPQTLFHREQAIAPVPDESSSPPSPDSATVTCSRATGTRGTSESPSCRHTVRRKYPRAFRAGSPPGLALLVIGALASATICAKRTRRTAARGTRSSRWLPRDSLIIATTALESIPPERNAPSGTSEMRRLRTDSWSRAASSSCHARASLTWRRRRSGTSQ